MSDVNVELWKQANAVYAKLMDLTVSDALTQLNHMDDLGDELKSLILTLISSGNQPSQYFNKHISSNFQLDEIHGSDLKPGDQVDGYELLEELGVGGMARVYQAKKTDADSHKPVAIKLFNRSGVSPILLNRFSVEQDVLSGLSHPNIVNMHHGGTSEQGVPYIVMDLIEAAEDIDQYVNSHDSGLKEKVEFIIAAARAIAYAHNNLIVHRDIKPSNLLIDDQGNLKVVDFGIAKLMTREDAPQKTTIMALTPSFAAPEQINSGKISVTTDVFSLAAVCLSLITEDLPLPADRLLKSCAGDEAHIWQVLKSHVSDNDLRNVLNQALQQHPEKRYRNMDLFADDLSAWLENKPVAATQDSWFYRINKFAKRRSALFASLLTLFVMVLAGVGVFSWQYKMTKIEAEKAIQVKNFMLQVFSYADPDANIAEKLSAYDLLSLAENEMQFQQFTDKSTQADILNAIGSAYSNLGAWDKGFEILERAVELNPQDISTNLKLVEIHLDRSEPELARDLMVKIEEMSGSLLEEEGIERADYLLLKSLQSVYEVGEGADLAYAQEAKAIYDQINDYNGVLKSSRVIAERHVTLTNAKEGLEEATNTLNAMQDKVSSVNTAMLRLKTTQIYLFIQLSQYDDAKTNLGDLIQNIRSVLGDKHPALIDALVQRASVLRNTGDMPNAIKDSEESYQIAVEVYGAISQMAQQSLAMVAQNKFATGERKEALDLVKQVVDMSVINYGEDHRSTLEAKGEYANYLGANGMTNEAIEMAQYVYDKQIEINGINDYKSIFAANVLLKLLAQQEEVEDGILQLAIDNNQRAVDNLETSHPQTAYSYFVLGNMYAKFGKFEEANAAFISLIDNGSVQKDNPRFLALSQAISGNYSAAGNQEKALEYARESWQAAEAMMGADAVRTVQIRLKMLSLMSAEEVEYQQHLKDLLEMVESGNLTEESLIETIRGL